MMTTQHDARAELPSRPKNRRHKWTQMISRCFFRHQGFGAGASCWMQMIITSVLWHHGQQPQSLIHVRHFIMWAQRTLHVANLWHAIQARVKEVCDCKKKKEIFLMHQQTRWHDYIFCLLSKSFSVRDMIRPCKPLMWCVFCWPSTMYTVIVRMKYFWIQVASSFILSYILFTVWMSWHFKFRL